LGSELWALGGRIWDGWGGEDGGTRLIMGERFCISASVTETNRAQYVLARFFFEVNRERTSFHESSSRLHLVRVNHALLYLDIILSVRATYPKLNWATY